MTRIRRSHVPGSRAGFSFVEVTVAVAVFGILASGVFLSLDRGSRFASRQMSDIRTTEQARSGLAAFWDSLTESRIGFVDTSSRFHFSTSYNVTTDRFSFTGAGWTQCVMPTCPAHTTSDLTRLYPAYHCAHEYQTGTGVAAATLPLGRIWPTTTLDSCPLDGGALTASARLDVLRYLVARDATGTFVTDQGGSTEADWIGMMIVAPVADPATGRHELRRFALYVKDLLEAEANGTGQCAWTGAFSRFDPAEPSFVNLLDFGTDGTTDGVPDGSLPVTAEQSDAEYEWFYVDTTNGGGILQILKSRGSLGSYPYLYHSLNLELRTGLVTWGVSIYESASSWWTATATFTRTPAVLATNVSEFAVSTAASHPYDAGTNPSGVEEPGVVRITIGTSRPERQGGTDTWVQSLASFVITPRN